MNVISQDAYAKIALNKSLLKEYTSSKYSRVVYLNDGDEFQIQLFNPEKYIIATKIYIDGEELNDMLVLRPGERIWLERYLDKARKFKFSTYEIEDSPEAKEAASLNGEVKVEFYRVKTRRQEPVVLGSTVYHYPYSNIHLGFGISDNISIAQNVSTAFYASQTDGALKGDIGSSITVANDATNSCNTAFGCSYSAEPKIETGRTEEGSYSHQKFSYVNYDFESWPFRTDMIQILPLSRKPHTNEELQKRYCSNCGRKLSPKHKYCPYCGTKVE